MGVLIMAVKPIRGENTSRIISEFKATYEVVISGCYLKTNDKFEGAFAVVPLDVKDLDLCSKIVVPLEVIFDFQIEACFLHYKVSVQQASESSALKLTFSGLQGSLNPLVSLTVEANEFTYLYPTLFYKLACIGYPQTYQLLKRDESPHGIR